jgi:hypothetical protein
MSAKFKRKSVDGGVDGLINRSEPGGIKVGILYGTGKHPDSDALYSEIAYWNEFGTERNGRKHIPARPFLRTAFRENRRDYIAIEKRLLRRILTGKITRKQAIGILGAKAQADVQQKIVDIRIPVNAPETLRKKAPKTNPLINTGLMRKHIAWEDVSTNA